jgi:dUTP pyrophosphatase
MANPEWENYQSAITQSVAIIGFKKLTSTATIPDKAHDDDLGFDLYTSEPVTMLPHSITKIPTGIAVQFPKGVGGIFKERSGLSLKTGLEIRAGVIDPQYTGELIVIMYNPTDTHHSFPIGAKIAQMVLVQSIPVAIAEIDSLHDTIRAGKGFGSSGS